MIGAAIRTLWDGAIRWGAIKSGQRRARRFGRFGDKSVICFPIAALFGDRYIHIGDGSIIGPYVSLSAGVAPGDAPKQDPAIRIGNRCVIGKGSGIVAHSRVEVGDDVWTGHHVYVTDANHGYEDPSEPIGRQFAIPKPVSIGDGSWLGHGALVMPGTTIGRHVVVGAGAVVTGDLPDYSVAVGNPARVVRRYVDGEGWVRAGEPQDPPARAGHLFAGDG
jgi:acetyltransferase-like isoleucine patch superfamily enzyme